MSTNLDLMKILIKQAETVRDIARGLPPKEADEFKRQYMQMLDDSRNGRLKSSTQCDES